MSKHDFWTTFSCVSSSWPDVSLFVRVSLLFVLHEHKPTGPVSGLAFIIIKNNFVFMGI